MLRGVAGANDYGVSIAMACVVCASDYMCMVVNQYCRIKNLKMNMDSLPMTDFLHV